MIKRTIYLSNPLYIKKEKSQLVICEKVDSSIVSSIPIEDIGIVIIDNPQISVSHGLMNALISNNATILWCDEKHMPNGLVLPMTANHSYTEKLRYQLSATEPLKKQLWKQTVKQKILNQAEVLNSAGFSDESLKRMSLRVASGDPDNIEAQAAAIYWSKLFTDTDVGFTRSRYGTPPNHLLNFGYAILRSIIARALVGSGLLPAIGIFHRNKYNAFCLADDIMEPYRPFVDLWVHDICSRYDIDDFSLQDKEIKREILKIPTLDVTINNKSSPLMIGAQRTSASLIACFEGQERKLKYPQM